MPINLENIPIFDQIEAETKSFLMTGNSNFLFEIAEIIDHNPTLKRKLCFYVKGIIQTINEQLGLLNDQSNIGKILRQLEAAFEIDDSHIADSFKDISLEDIILREQQIFMLVGERENAN